MSALEAHTSAPPERLIAGCGSVALCQQIVQAVAGEGDEVVFGWRSFEAYPIVTQITGATAVRVPVTADHELDLPAIAEAVGSSDPARLRLHPQQPDRHGGPAETPWSSSSMRCPRTCWWSSTRRTGSSTATRTRRTGSSSR